MGQARKRSVDSFLFSIQQILERLMLIATNLNNELIFYIINNIQINWKINMQHKFPIFYAGSKHLFDSLPQQCRIKQTLLLPHPCVIHQTIEFLPLMKKQYLEPIVTIIVLTESQGEQIIKGNLQLAQPGNTIYVYYPYELPVDEFVYKQANNTYESILKEVPRGMRDHFCKYLEWKDGKGDHSISAHVSKLVNLIQKETKIQIQKRVTALLADIASNEQEPITHYKIYRQWSSRTKLTMLYHHLSLYNLVQPILQTQYALIKAHLSLFDSPCDIRTSFNPIIQQFDSFFIKMERKELDKLQVVTQIYLLTLNHLILTLKLSQSLNLMRHLLMFVREEVFAQRGDIAVQICNKLWEIQIVEFTTNELIKQKGLTISGKIQLESQIVQYKIYSRKSIQWIGRLLLGFNPSIYSLKPKEQEISSLLDELSGTSPSSPFQVPQPNHNLLLDLQVQLSSIESQDLKKGLKSFKDFIEMESITLSKTISFLKQTKFRRFQIQLQIQLYLISIYFLEINRDVIMDIVKNQRIPAEFSTWMDLSFVHKIYFCRVLNKMQEKEMLCEKLLQLTDNSVLETKERNKILQYINNQLKEQKKYKKQIGQILNAKVIKTKGNKNIILVEFDLPWGVEVDNISIKFSDIKKKQYFYESGNKDTFQRGRNKKEIQIVVEEGNHLLFKSCSVSCGKVCYDISTYKIKDSKIQLETLSITTHWDFGEEICYNHIYTPVRYSIKGLEEKQKLVFQWTSQLELSKIGWVDGQQIVIDNLTQIELTGDKEHTIEIFIAPFHKKGCVYAAIDLRLGNYTLKDDYAIKFKSPISANLRLQGKFIQYKISNIVGHSLHVKTQKGKEYKLEKEQELKLLNKKIFIGLTSHSLIELMIDQLCEEKMSVSVNQDKFSLRLQTQELKIFQTIRFKSDAIGNIRILAREGYEVVGKVKGQVGYRNKDQQILQVGIVPTRVGKIVLPDVEIDNKKGEWKHPLILQVK